MTAIGQQNPILLFLATPCHHHRCCCSALSAAGITRGSHRYRSCCCVCCWSIRNEAEGEQQLERTQSRRYKNINSLGGRAIRNIASFYLSERLTNTKKKKDRKFHANVNQRDLHCVTASHRGEYMSMPGEFRIGDISDIKIRNLR